MNLGKTKPFFTIVTVCLNNLDGLKCTYQSLKEQSCKDYEWIVVDGESNDGTVEWIRSLAEGSCRWISEPDKGLYDAMNKGIDIATGRWLLFLNSGDELATADVLERVVEVSDRHVKAAMIYGDALERMDDGALVLKPAHSASRVWYGMFTHHQAMIYQRDFVGAQRYRLDYRIAADYAFTCELLGRHAEAIHEPLPVCIFEGGGITSTGDVHVEGMKEQWRIGRDILKRAIPQRLFVLGMHLAKHAVMRLTPGMYRRIRYREVKHV